MVLEQKIVKVCLYKYKKELNPTNEVFKWSFWPLSLWLDEEESEWYVAFVEEGGHSRDSYKTESF